MRYLRTPNTTFDLYILPNVPPAAPDYQGAGYLRAWFWPGMQLNQGATGRPFLVTTKLSPFSARAISSENLVLAS